MLSGVLWLGCTRRESKSLALPLEGAPAASAPLPGDPTIASGQLDNGLRYLLKPAGNQGGAVALVLALRVGSAAERDNEREFAHLIEHLAFDRAQRFGSVAPVEFLQRLGVALGADVNAETASSHTVYRLIVADLADGDLQRLVERYLASLPGTPRADRMAPPDEERRPGITRVRLAGRPGNQDEVLLEFQRKVAPSAKARIDLEALAAYLRLALRDTLREKLGRVYAVEVETNRNGSGGSLRVSFECQHEDVSLLEAATLELSSELRQGRVSAALLETTKAQLAEHFRRATGSNSFWADELEQAFTYGTDPRDILELPKLGAQLTAEQLAQAARRYLTPDQYLDAVWSAR